jgi:hypothetical protein
MTAVVMPTGLDITPVAPGMPVALNARSLLAMAEGTSASPV